LPEALIAEVPHTTPCRMMQLTGYRSDTKIASLQYTFFESPKGRYIQHELENEGNFFLA
jgi:hypothetical protein